MKGSATMQGDSTSFRILPCYSFFPDYMSPTCYFRERKRFPEGKKASKEGRAAQTEEKIMEVVLKSPNSACFSPTLSNHTLPPATICCVCICACDSLHMCMHGTCTQSHTIGHITHSGLELDAKNWIQGNAKLT